MPFSKLLQWLPGLSRSSWPKGLPRLYKKLDEESLASFLSPAEARRLRTVPKVLIGPRLSGSRLSENDFFACGVSRVLIRNLMLVRGLSVRGPEDSHPTALKDELVEFLGSDYDVIVLVDANLKRGALRLYIERGERGRETLDIRAESFSALLAEASTKLAAALAGNVRLTVSSGWKSGQPAHQETLIKIGRHILEDRRLSDDGLIDLWNEDPEFATVLWGVDDEGGELFLHAVEADPYNAQLYFHLFCSVWSGGTSEPWALQFCRRAIELSPGHGKAQMCAPHAASPNVDMLAHSELGYLLLPGNTFAVNNYILYLEQAGKPHRLLELAEEAIADDPQNPGAYEQAIQVCRDLGEYQKALDLARRLAVLYGPPMNPRTKYCIEQNPAQGAALRDGSYEPWRENAQLVSELEILAGAGEIA